MKLSMSGFLEGRRRYIQTVPRGTGVPMCNVVQRGATRCNVVTSTLLMNLERMVELDMPESEDLSD